MNDAAKTVQNDWLTSETLDIIDQKRTARLSGIMSEYKALCATSKESVLCDKQQWADNIASEAEKARQCRQLNDAFCNFRRLRSTGPRISSSVAPADGTLVTDKSQKLSRWKDHFSNLLNRPPAQLSEDLVSAASTAPVDPAISRAPPSEEEVQRALNRLMNGKAPGICNIPQTC